MIGAILGICISYLILMPLKPDSDILPQDWVVKMCPTGLTDDAEVIEGCDLNRDRISASFVFQIVGSFIFVMSFLMVFSKQSSPCEDYVLGVYAIVATCLSQVTLGNLVGAAYFNPLIALSLHIFASFTLQD